MRKLELKLEELRVDSFETAMPVQERGTVHGEQLSRYCPSARCSGEDGVTCDMSCGGTCGDCSSDCYLTGPDITRYYIDGACA